MQHFRSSKNKLAYAYLLTPEGLDTKARVTARFLQRKRTEYDALKVELEQLTAEAKVEGLLTPSFRPGSRKQGQGPGNRASNTEQTNETANP